MTTFACDPVAWGTLREQVLPAVLGQCAKEAEALRAWVPGCGQGAEAYSLAILLTEAAETEGFPARLRIYATDAAEDALMIARAGTYAAAQVEQLSPQRRRRFFTRDDGVFRVKQGVREKIIFAPHDLVTDPPFSRIALISCRNLLSEVEPDQAGRILAQFHFALQPSGYLFLGAGKPPEAIDDLFVSVIENAPIYQRLDEGGAIARALRASAPRACALRLPRQDAAPERAASNYPDFHARALLERSREELQSLNQELMMVNSQLENKVRQLEELNNDLRNLLVSTDIATLFLDRDLRIRRYTPAAEELVDLKPENLDRALTEVDWAFADDALLDDIQAMLAGRALDPREIQSHDQRWYLRQVRPYRTDETLIEGVVVTFTEITHRKRTEMALRHSEASLRRITDGLPVLIAYVDRDCRYRFNNARYRDWFGIDPDSVYGHRVQDVIGETSFAAIRPLVEQVFSGEPAHFEGWLGYTHGGPKCVSAQYIPDVDESGEVQGFFALVTDITDRRAAEERLERLRQDNQRNLDEIQALLEAAPIGIFFARDKACTDMTMNRAGAELLRLDPDSNPSKSGPDGVALGFRVFHDAQELAPEELPMQRAASLGHTIGGFELVIAFPDGDELNLLTYAAPLFDEDGHVRGSVGTFVDVSEQKRLEARLRQQTRNLEAINRRKDQFMAMLGHELRNPLTPIRSAVYLLRLDDQRTVDRGWAAEMIDRQIGHLERMVDDLLDVARVRRGTLSLSCDRHALQDLLAECVDSLRPACEQKHQHLTVDLPKEPVTVFGDGTRLIQVFSNLLHNATRYTPEGGDIRISLRQCDGMPGAKAQPEQVHVEVEDTGKGISADLLPHVFDIFDSERPHPDRAHAGLGLGLTLVKQIVQLHGGWVEASSPGVDRGSRFRVTLPVAHVHPANLEEGAQTPGPATVETGAKPLTEDRLDVLVVDDNLDILEAIAGLLRGLGHRVKVLDAGSRVLATVRENPVDLVLLDIGLPDIDGYQVAHELAAEPYRDQLRVVAITGYAESGTISEGDGSGFDGRLLKPFTLKQLRPFLAKKGKAGRSAD